MQICVTRPQCVKTETESVYCAVRTGSLNIIQVHLLHLVLKKQHVRGQRRFVCSVRDGSNDGGCGTTAYTVNNCPTRCDYIQFYYISANSSTCLGWYLHPLSGAHVNCNYSIWHWSNSVPTPPRQRKVGNTVRTLPDDVVTVYVCSWWWVKVSPKTCRAICRNIKNCL